MNTTYTPTSTVTLESVYPNGVAVPVGFVASEFAPPQKGQSFIAADTLKGKRGATSPNARVVVARENNSATSSPRVIIVRG